MAIEVAAGYVSIAPSLKNFTRDLTAQMDPALAKAGAQAGDDVGKNFTSSLQKSMGNVGTKLTQWVSLPLAGLGTASLMLAADFESSMSQVAQAVGKPGDKLTDLTKLAKQLGADTQYSAREAADAMVELAKGGFTEAQIKAGSLKTAMDLAAAGQLDLKEAANLTVSAMGAFGLEATDAAQIADALAGAANSSSSDVSDLAQALTQVGASAKQNGLSIQETTAALAAFADAGIKGSDAGTSLKTMLANLLPDGTEKTGAMLTLIADRAGVVASPMGPFAKANGEMKSMSEIAEILNVSLSDMSEAQKSHTLQTLFGTDAYRAAAILTDQGAAGLAKYEAATNKVGSAQEAAAANLGPTARAIEETKGAAETAAMAIGEALAPTVSKLARGAQSLFGWFSRLPAGVQQTGAAAGVLAMALGPVLVITSKLITAFGIVRGALLSERAALIASKVAWLARQAAFGVQALWAVITTIGQATAGWLLNTASVVANKVALAAGVIVMGAVKAATVAWTVVQWALNTALNANPIGLVVMAIGALVAAVVLLWNKNEGFRNFILGAWAAIKVAAEVVWGGIKQVIEVVWSAIEWYVRTYITVVKTIIETVWNWIRDTTTTIWGGIKAVIEAVWDAISWYVTTYINTVKTVITTAWNLIKTGTDLAWTAIKDFIINPIAKAWERVGDIVGTVRDWLSSTWTIIKDRASTAWNNIKDAITGPVKAVWEALVGFLGEGGTLRTKLSETWTAIKTTASDAWQAVKSAITSPIAGLWSDFKDFLGVSDKGQIEEGKGALGKLVSAFGAVPAAVKKVFDGITAAIKDPINAAFKWVNDNVILSINTKILKPLGVEEKDYLPNLPQFAKGGLASGPKDGYLAMLHGDEFVVNATATAKNRGLLEAINAGNISAGATTVANSQPGAGLLSGIGDLAKAAMQKGAEFAINMIGDPAVTALDRLVGGSLGGDLAVGTLQKLMGGITTWAKKLLIAPTGIMEALASYMEAKIGDFVGFSTCLKNINAAMAALESRMGFSTNGWLDAYSAKDTTASVKGAGLMRYTTPPRGAVVLWDERTGRGWGHIAAADGRGNTVNNYGGAYVERVPLSQQQQGYVGWTPPESFITGKFDAGGMLQPGWTATFNGTGKPEPVLTSAQWRTLTDARTGPTGPRVENHWSVQATTVPTVDAVMTAWSRWEALQVL